MRKRPEIPEDVFFDTQPTREEPEDQAGQPPDESQPDSESQSEDEDRPDDLSDDRLAKSMGESRERTRVKLSDVRAERERRAAARAEPENEESSARVGRPPAQEGPKIAVTLYLTEPVAHLLEEVKFRLLTEYDVRTSKSAVADFGLRNGLTDLQAAADDLRRD